MASTPLRWVCFATVVGWLVMALPAAENAPSREAPGLGDPGSLERLEWDCGPLADGVLELAGRDAYRQLVVAGVYDSGQVRDFTRKVRFQIEPANLARVTEEGLLLPQEEGEGRLVVAADGVQPLEVPLRITHLKEDLPVHFEHQIVPIFTKYGCNGGGCHGKSGGQNGFRLSLLGFEPSEDYEYLVKEARGRRLFFAAPERSLLLQKATAEVPHGGGQRMERGSAAYQLLRRWIEQGAPYGDPQAPVVTSIQVYPSERLMSRKADQQLAVVAYRSDGSFIDVTRMTQFDSNDTEMADVSVTGLVTTGQLSGSVAVMARYQGHVAVFRATIPLGLSVELPEASNVVDQHVFAQLKKLGLPPSPLCDDATFLRRATIDIAGRLPTLEETEQFLADTRPNKRQILVDYLLDSPDYADYFANKWSAILRNKRRSDVDRRATFAFHAWIRDSFLANKPYDQFVAEILTATGQPDVNPPAGWYREVSDQAAQVEDTAQLFLGLRIQCARCHHHPFEKWSQQDYYGLAAFFSQLSKKKGDQPGLDRIVCRTAAPQAQNPKTGKPVPPTGLGGPTFDVPPYVDARQVLVQWMRSPDNPFFARALVNRYWKHFFGRGLVEPEDDMRVTNPASNPELLDALARDFIEHGFDLKHLIRTICLSQTYQRSAEPNEWNRDDKQNFSRYYPKRLNAEVLLDAINQVTDSATDFGGLPVGTRATQLPDNGFNSYFLTVFGRPEASSACECERSSDANLAQSLHLLNSAEIQGKLTANDGRAARLAADQNRPLDQRIRELYLVSFSREPTSEEVAIAQGYIEKTGDARRAFEDIVWALINTKEFLFNH
ncbi:MAG: S-layer protein [Pirellulaceae bacterium]|nr:MAG: S-layer protein [Pirellulaceae bacterium]